MGMPSSTGYAQALSERTISVDVTPNGAGSSFDRGINSLEPIARRASASDIARRGSLVCGQMKISWPAVRAGMSIGMGIRTSWNCGTFHYRGMGQLLETAGL